MTMIASLLCSLLLVSTNSSCVVTEEGARVVSWKVGGKELLWNPAVAETATNKWRHGGMPICWPWFGQCEKWPPHGSAWLSRANVVRRGEDSVDLGLDDGENALSAVYTIALAGNEMRLRVATRNSSPSPRSFSLGLHPYFALADRDSARIEGLAGWTYFDWRDPKMQKRTWNGDVVLAGAFDHSFQKTPALRDAAATLVDPLRGLHISLRAAMADEYVVWNPGADWPEGGPGFIGGFSKGDCMRFVCLEPGFFEVKPTRIAPGETVVMEASFSVARSE